ncbi:hypothetical protein KM043_007243 [Ampulex compressa]|nr:hypothetical protein KM043_007243 [Ampulex compressa]
MLVSDGTNLLKGPIFEHKEYNERKLRLKDNLVAHHDKDMVFDKSAYNGKGQAAYQNSNKLLQQLQPVPVQPAVTLGEDELGMVRNLEDQQKRDEGYKSFSFNILVSDNLGLLREVVTLYSG